MRRKSHKTAKRTSWEHLETKRADPEKPAKIFDRYTVAQLAEIQRLVDELTAQLINQDRGSE